MPTVKLSEGFLNLQEGPQQVLKIYKVKHDTTFNKIRLYYMDERGATSNDQFQIDKSNKNRRVALNKFSTIAKAALNDFKAKNIDPMTLEGKFIKADVYYEVPEKGPYKGRTFTRLNNVQPTDESFEEPVWEDEDDEDFEEDDEIEENEVEEDDDDDELFD